MVPGCKIMSYFSSFDCLFVQEVRHLSQSTFHVSFSSGAPLERQLQPQLCLLLSISSDALDEVRHQDSRASSSRVAVSRASSDERSTDRIDMAAEEF